MMSGAFFAGPEWRMPGGVYQPGLFYCTYAGVQLPTTAVESADRLYLTPFEVFGRLDLQSVAIRVVTGGANSAYKAAIYADENGRPLGDPVVSNTTGAATVNNNSIASLSMVASLSRGFYWIGRKFTGTLPACVSIQNNSNPMNMKWGRASITTGAWTSFSVEDNYANAFPELTAETSYTEGVAAGVPIIWLGT